jgi:D-alanyl-D-alanine carboxypeptidase
MRRRCVAAGLAVALAAVAIITTAAPAGARVPPKPQVVDAETLTPRQITDQVKAADALRADLMRSNAGVAAANTRLERLSAQANTILASLSAARTAGLAAQREAGAQRARLIRLGTEVGLALDALGQLASDSYIRSGGPLGDVVAIIESLSSPTADQSTNSMATMQYVLDGRARVFARMRSLRAEQVLTSARAEAASRRAAAAARTAAEAKSALDAVIAQQRSALDALKSAQAGQVGRAAGLRSNLLRSEDAASRAADGRLAQALAGQDFILLMDTSTSCGKGSVDYPNGRLPASALCPLYAAPGESLSRDASLAFNAMSNAYQRESGSALCVTDGYRSYAEQVAVKLARPKLAASPGTSQHGLGLAVDLCGGVQSFANPAHLWMQRNAPLYGWFHPAWAEPTGGLPEPWHWEFAS